MKTAKIPRGWIVDGVVDWSSADRITNAARVIIASTLESICLLYHSYEKAWSLRAEAYLVWRNPCVKQLFGIARYNRSGRLLTAPQLRSMVLFVLECSTSRLEVPLPLFGPMLGVIQPWGTCPFSIKRRSNCLEAEPGSAICSIVKNVRVSQREPCFLIVYRYHFSVGEPTLSWC